MREKEAPINDSRRRDARRRACEELSKALGADDGLSTARRLLVATAAATPAGDSASPPPPGPRPISIWRPLSRAGELVFERPEPLPLGDHYAARRRIRAAKEAGRRRVAFFGESAAAGYLYAPHVTPAAVLETQLALLGGGWEVVDLARTNETLGGLVRTVESSLQLDPDLLVIFAGNNWNLLETPEISPWVPSVEARQRYARALADGGLAGPAVLAARELARTAKGALDAVAELAGRARIPVVAVVPEVNLADWESRQPVPWLPGGGTAEWYELYRGALRCLAGERWTAAIALAGKMRRLDGGSLGTTYRILARAETGRGRPAEARWACRAEVDHTSYATLAFLDAPRATSDAQDVLRRAADRHGWAVVDLPSVFAERETVPGRRFFLDYCHLTSEGIRTAMAAVASEIAGRLAGREVERGAFERVDVPVSGAAEATARFGAAVHGAHRLLTLDGERPILEHWCREALAASPGIADAMLDLVAARSSPCPAVLTASQELNLSRPYRLLLQHGWRWDFLDVELVETVCRVLEEAGRPVRGEVERLAAERLSGTRTDLARPPWLWEPLERFYPEVMDFADVDQWGVLRAPWPASSFCLVARGDQDVDLELTARLPAIEGFASRTGAAVVRVGGREVERIPLGEAWTRRRFRVSELRPGFNRVTVEWPSLPPAGDEAMCSILRDLEMGRGAAIHPVFGEIASLIRHPSSRARAS